ncbi:heavy metal translocating P-type ATPase [Methanobrevibacter sp. DSM 116169]|uniref:heavy metal translocating P-type ATPase n=1 Tax=Methanobrevibacter sp. DSM 116169 TaxID=3242727 RepID=UPI0038FC22A5
MAKTKNIDIPIEGMHCASCVLNLNKAFEKIEGVKEVNADLNSNKLHLLVDYKKVSYDKINEVVESLGFKTRADEVTLQIEGMHCASCVMNVENFLGKLDGIFQVHADLTSNTTQILYNKDQVSLKQMEDVIKSLGFKVLGIKGQSNLNEEELYKKDLKDKRNRIIVGLIFSGILMALMYIHVDVFGLSMGELSLIISIAPFIYVSLPILKAGFNGLIHKNLNMDVMYSMGIVVAYVSSILGTFHIVLDHSFMFYESAIMLPSFLLIGRYLEARAKNETSSSIKELIGLQPKNANLITLDDDNNILTEKVIKIADINIGDILLVKPGDKIPVDGKVIDGNSYIDEAMINGEPIPRTVKKDDELFAGTINQDGVLKITALKIGKDTVLSQIISLVEKAQSSRPPVQKIANVAVSYFIPVILGIAILTFIIWYFILDSTLLFALTTLISILVIACPCALGLATPTAVTVGTGRAAEYGILIKDGDTLENTGKVDVVAFDKTGTITQGKPTVQEIFSYDLKEEDVLKYIASLEKNSNHPIAKAILNKAENLNLDLFTVNDFENISGKGIYGFINDEKVIVGNLSFLKSENIDISENPLKDFENSINQNKTAIFLVINSEIKGLITLSDKIKDNSKRTIDELHKMGIKTYMITGDNEKTASDVASQVGIDNIDANVLPADKLNIVKSIQDKGNKVIFVGDGINDAPALTQADIGVAMGNGTDVAMESGNIVIIEGDLENVVAAIQFSKKVMKRIKENIFWAFAYNGILIPVAAGVLYPTFGIVFMPEWAAFAMALSSVTVISLSLMLKRYVPPIKQVKN